MSQPRPENAGLIFEDLFLNKHGFTNAIPGGGGWWWKQTTEHCKAVVHTSGWENGADHPYLTFGVIHAELTKVWKEVLDPRVEDHSPSATNAIGDRRQWHTGHLREDMDEYLDLCVPQILELASDPDYVRKTLAESRERKYAKADGSKGFVQLSGPVAASALMAGWTERDDRNYVGHWGGIAERISEERPDDAQFYRDQIDRIHAWVAENPDGVPGWQ